MCINTLSVLAEVYIVIRSLYVILNTKSHQLVTSTRFARKDQRRFYTNYFDLQQMKIASLPQAGNLLFIDKVREKEMVFCYEKTVYYWFSNLWMGREKTQKYIYNPNSLQIFAFCLLNTNNMSKYTFFIFSPLLRESRSKENFLSTRYFFRI